MPLNSLTSFDKMNGYDFENYCAKLLKSNGFSSVEVTRGSGDNGVDILAKKHGISYAIQCKRFNGKVGSKAIQEVYSGAALYGTDRAAVMTNSFFTDQAVNAANRLGVELWDRDVIKSFEGDKSSYRIGCLIAIGILLGLVVASILETVWTAS